MVDIPTVGAADDIWGRADLPPFVDSARLGQLSLRGRDTRLANQGALRDIRRDSGRFTGSCVLYAGGWSIDVLMFVSVQIG